MNRPVKRTIGNDEVNLVFSGIQSASGAWGRFCDFGVSTAPNIARTRMSHLLSDDIPDVPDGSRTIVRHRHFALTSTRRSQGYDQ